MPNQGYIAWYQCPCGQRFPVRRQGRARPAGHVKSIWCVRCKKVTPHKALGKKA